MNKILYRLAKRLSAEVGVLTLRLNFRGVGLSEGVYDHGRGEVDDPVAAWKELILEIIPDTSHLFPGHEDAAVEAVIPYILALTSDPGE